MVYITRLFEPEDFLMRQTRYLLKMYTPGQPDAQGTAEVQASKVVFALQNVFQQEECDNFVQVLYMGMGVFKCWEI